MNHTSVFNICQSLTEMVKIILIFFLHNNAQVQSSLLQKFDSNKIDWKQTDADLRLAFQFNFWIKSSKKRIVKIYGVQYKIYKQHLYVGKLFS